MAATISLAMIVKDEAEQLGECLNSVRDLVHEICIVDTGSSDDTLEIARAFHAKTAVYIWSDDFAAARNESLRLCTKDWILVLDADERIASGDAAKLRALVQGPHDCCYRFTTRNYTNNSAVADFHPCEPNDRMARGFAGWFPSAKVRLFPNRRGIRFNGKVHELVNRSLEQQGMRVIDTTVPIHHYPLEKGPQRLRHKQSLYLQLGHAKVSADPKDPKGYVELGNQYAEVGDYANAAAAYREAVKLDSSNAAVWADLGGALHMLTRDEEARKALKIALEINPGLGAAWRNLGVLQADAKDWQGAIDCFNRALQVDPQWADGHRYLSVAIEGAGRLTEAAEESRKALDARPLCLECLKLYIHQMLRLECRADARAFLLSLIERGAESAPLHNALGELYFYDNLLDEAVAHFKRAGQGGMASAYNNAGVALFRQGRYAEAKTAFERCLEADPGHRGARANLEKALGRLAHV